jgi:hypothetical protein
LTVGSRAVCVELNLTDDLYVNYVTLIIINSLEGEVLFQNIKVPFGSQVIRIYIYIYIYIYMQIILLNKFCAISLTFKEFCTLSFNTTLFADDTDMNSQIQEC